MAAGTTKKPLKGVLLLDETVVSLTCDDLQRGFSEWRRDPTRSVGFFPLWQEDSRYSMLSDRALFVHRSFLPTRTDSATMATTTTRTLSHACQEWVISARVAAVSQKHAIAMASKSAQRFHDDAAHSSCNAVVADALAVSDLPSTGKWFVGGLK